MGDWIKNLLESGSYPAIAGLMVLENVFPPIPSELIMPLAGFVASRGELNIWLVILAGAVGSLLGQLPLYYLGKAVGYERLRAWADKHGKWLTVDGDDITKSKEWFERHGTKSVLLARVVPGVRSLISIPAGFAKMPLVPFLAYSAVGTTAWTAALALIGRALGAKYELVDRYLGPATWVVLGGIVLTMILRTVKGKGKKGDGAKAAA
jgi:membrane protein DedA with SNARE-associated domain